jgi:hypothetical protein
MFVKIKENITVLQIYSHVSNILNFFYKKYKKFWHAIVLFNDCHISYSIRRDLNYINIMFEYRVLTWYIIVEERSGFRIYYFMLFSGLLIYPWTLYLIISQWKFSKYNFTLFNDETTFWKFSPCGTSILFLLTILTMSDFLKKKQSWNR